MRSPRILVADDAPEVRALLALVLSKAGAEVRVAEHGNEAYDLVQRAEGAGMPFDLILLDVEMPELDGRATASRLRARGCTAPIVAVTAHEGADEVDRCRRAGCDEVLRKPTRTETLLATVTRLLAARGRGVVLGGDEQQMISPRELREGLTRLTAGFAERLPDRASALEQALAAGDVGEIGALAHRLRGTAGAYGFDVVAEAAADLQADVAARAGLDQVRDRVARVAELCRRTATSTRIAR